MTRLRLAAAGLAAGLAASPGLGQPPQPPTALKSFGVDPAGFYRSAVGRWADQLARDLADARGDLRAAPVAPRVREAAASRAQQAEDAARDLSRAVRRGAERDQVARRFEELEKEVSALTELVVRNQGLGPVFTRATYSYQQLAAATGEGDTD
ncbi:MAG: hypothetical protein K2X87_12360, partial [Gemmataceae bacterium]|nr:hypothetical protein [Gemmataceae bacterium]